MSQEPKVRSDWSAYVRGRLKFYIIGIPLMFVTVGVLFFLKEELGIDLSSKTLLDNSSSWTFNQQKDQMTDELVNSVYKNFELDNGDNVQATMKCGFYSGDLIPVVEIQFLLLDEDSKPTKPFRGQVTNRNSYFVSTTYRMGSLPSAQEFSESNYNNVAILEFSRGGKKETNLPKIKDLVAYQHLRVELPTNDDLQPVVQIDMSDSEIKRFIESCPVLPGSE